MGLASGTQSFAMSPVRAAVSEKMGAWPETVHVQKSSGAACATHGVSLCGALFVLFFVSKGAGELPFEGFSYLGDSSTWRLRVP